jgi:hypothetical protein
MGEKRGEGKILFVRPRFRWEDNIKVNLKSVGRVWTGLV